MLPRRGKKIFFGGNGRVCDICSREALSGGCSAASWPTASEAAGSVSASAAGRASTASTQGDGSPPETVQGGAARRPAPAHRSTAASTSGAACDPASTGAASTGTTASTSTTDDATTASTSTPQHDTSTGTTAQAMHGRRRSTTLHAMGDAITQPPRALQDATPTVLLLSPRSPSRKQRIAAAATISAARRTQ